MSEQQPTLTFEQAMANLEQALKAPLEEAVEQYKLGLDMASQCQKMLRDAEGEIRILQDGVEKAFQMEE